MLFGYQAAHAVTTPSGMMIVHRRTDRWQRAALLSGSIARNRAGGVDRFDQSAAGVGPGPGFFEAVSDCPARRLERVVEFVAGIAFGDSQYNRGAFDRALSKWRVMVVPRTLSLRRGLD
jgi:hypothetical protein